MNNYTFGGRGPQYGPVWQPDAQAGQQNTGHSQQIAAPIPVGPDHAQVLSNGGYYRILKRGGYGRGQGRNGPDGNGARGGGGGVGVGGGQNSYTPPHNPQHGYDPNYPQQGHNPQQGYLQQDYNSQQGYSPLQGPDQSYQVQNQYYQPGHTSSYQPRPKKVSHPREGHITPGSSVQSMREKNPEIAKLETNIRTIEAAHRASGIDMFDPSQQVATARDLPIRRAHNYKAGSDRASAIDVDKEEDLPDKSPQVHDYNRPTDDDFDITFEGAVEDDGIPGQ